jgi:protein-S-isoprenylcysteine O-methyltransferase Ste14
VSSAPVLGASVVVAVPALVAREAERHGGSAAPAAAAVAIAIAVVCAVLVPVLGQRFVKRDTAIA